MTDDSVLAKFAIVRENLEKLELLPQSSYAEFSADFRNLDSALHRLQTTIQALIDVASYLVSVRGLGVPKTSLDALEKLETGGLLPQGSARRFTRSFASEIVWRTCTTESIPKSCTAS